MDVTITATATDVQGRSLSSSLVVTVLFDLYSDTYLGDYGNA